MGSFKLSSIFTIICFITLTACINLSFAQNSCRDYVDAHNQARAAVGVDLPPMSWNRTLEKYAQDYANGVLNANSCFTLVHSQGPYGENLAAGFPDMTGTQAVKMWVAEKVDYNYGDNSCTEGKMCGHYTQVVWRNSVHLGCARVHCDNSNWSYVICSYDPPGNYIGERPY